MSGLSDGGSESAANWQRLPANVGGFVEEKQRSRVKTLDPNVLEKVAQRIVAVLQPERIVLYGSHAYGQPDEDSDVDLLVIVSGSSLPPHKRAIKAYRALRGLFFPAEVKVVTRAEFDRRSQWTSSIERVARERGTVLYESSAG